MNDSEKKDMLKAVFDALPSMVFVVDQDVRIHEYNTSAHELLMAERKNVLKHRAGTIFHCLHASDVPEGCGRAPFCKNCVVRNAVAEAFQGKRIIRRRTRLDLIRDGKNIEVYALVTASPFCFRDRAQVLLVVEDISEIAELQRMIPICSICRKVRDDKEAWMQLESYFKNKWDVDFSHGYCPDCFKIEQEKLEAYCKSEEGKPAGGNKRQS